MTLTEFKQMQKESRETHLIDNGVYLLTRQEPEYYIDLYQLDKFYVEAYYHCGLNKLVYLRAFSTSEDLNPYLKQIDINGLFQG